MPNPWQAYYWQDPIGMNIFSKLTILQDGRNVGHVEAHTLPYTQHKQKRPSKNEGLLIYNVMANKDYS